MAGQQSTFDTLLGKLSSLIGDDNPEATAYGVKNALFGFPGVSKATNALNPDPQVTNRASMLPIGNYEDGSVGLAWPQSAVDAYEAIGRFGRGENPQPQDAVLAGLAMTGGGFGSLAGRGVRAVSGRALEGVEPPVALPSHSVEAGSAPVTARVYRGTGYPESETGHPGPYFASDSPAVAATYAEGQAPAVYPSDVTFRNPMVLDAAGGTYNDLPGFGGNMYAAVEAARKAGNDGLVLRNIRDPMRGEGGPVATTYAAISPGTVRSSTTGETLFSNPKEAAPAGLLATSGLDRMRVEDTAKPRSIPDAPMSLDDLQSYVDQNFENGSGNRVIAARAENPQRYWDYANGLHDVINPESDWISSGPTLQSGGVSGAAVGTAGSSEHHSRSQPRGEGGRFVAKDSFDGRLAALDKMMVDLDGDGTPDVAMPANALLAQSSPREQLRDRGYLDQLPPTVTTKDALGDEQIKAYEDYMRPRIAPMNALGVPYGEARGLIEEMPDVRSYRQRLTQESLQDPKVQEEIRNLLERLR